MGNLKPDYSFERDGVSFGEWLSRLVAEDRPTREAAGDVLMAMWHGLPSLDTDWADLTEQLDYAAQQVRFKEAVRSTVNAEDFDTAGYVCALCGYLMVISKDWMRHT